MPGNLHEDDYAPPALYVRTSAADYERTLNRMRHKCTPEQIAEFELKLANLKSIELEKVKQRATNAEAKVPESVESENI